MLSVKFSPPWLFSCAFLCVCVCVCFSFCWRFSLDSSTRQSRLVGILSEWGELYPLTRYSATNVILPLSPAFLSAPARSQSASISCVISVPIRKTSAVSISSGSLVPLSRDRAGKQ